MNSAERRQLIEILLKLTPIAVAYASGKAMGAAGDSPVPVCMSMIEDAAGGLRDLKVLLYGKTSDSHVI